MCLVQGYFALALLGAEPESAEQAEEDVYQQEDYNGCPISYFIILSLLEVLADILERTDVADVDVSYTELLLAIRFQAFDKIHILIGTDTNAEFGIGVPENLFEH